MTKGWKQKGITYNPETDQKLIDFMSRQLPNASQYILGLVEKDMLSRDTTNISYDENYLRELIEKILMEKGLI